MTPDPTAPTVLLMEDEALLRDVFVDRLTDEYEVIQAEGGEPGLGKLDGDVDVVLIDRRMPNLDGDTALRTLRDRGFDCPVGILSAVEPSADVIDLPFDLYLVKPIALGELMGAVETLLDRARMAAETRRCYALGAKIELLRGYVPNTAWRAEPELAELLSRFETSLADLNPADRAEVEDTYHGYPFDGLPKIHE